MIPFCALLAVATPAAAPAPPVTAVVRALESYDELVAEYEAVYDAWRQALREAEDFDQRRALRDRRPATEFAPRFEALAAAGEGRAHLWQLDNLHRMGLLGGAREEKRDAVYDSLFEHHRSEPWIGEALDRLWGDRSRIAPEDFRDWVGATHAANERNDLRGRAEYMLGGFDARSDVEADRERGFAALDALIERRPESEWAEMARSDLLQLRDLAVGRPAMDFEGKTVDGDTFRLSDFEGKVVLLDFWGFW